MVKSTVSPSGLSLKKKIGFSGLAGIVGALGLTIFVEQGVRLTLDEGFKKLKLRGRECTALYHHPPETPWCFLRDQTVSGYNYSTDGHGFLWEGTLPPTITTPRPPKTTRLLQLGGSTSAGVFYAGEGPEAHTGYYKTLESALQETLIGNGVDTKVEVLPGAFHGFDFGSMRLVYEHEGVTTDPSAVLLYEGFNEFGSAFTDAEDTAIKDYLETGDETNFAALKPWFTKNIQYFREQRDLITAMNSADPRTSLTKILKHNQLVYGGLQTLGKILLDHSLAARKLTHGAEAFDVGRYNQYQPSSSGTSPFDEEFVSTHLVDNVTKILDDAASRGIITVLEIPTEGFACNPTDVRLFRNGLVLGANDYHAFVTRSVPAMLRTIGQHHGLRINPQTGEYERGSIIIDHAAAFARNPDNRCDYFRENGRGDEMHFSREGFRVRARTTAEALAPYLTALEKNNP